MNITKDKYKCLDTINFYGEELSFYNIKVAERNGLDGVTKSTPGIEKCAALRTSKTVSEDLGETRGENSTHIVCAVVDEY